MLKGIRLNDNYHQHKCMLERKLLCYSRQQQHQPMENQLQFRPELYWIVHGSQRSYITNRLRDRLTLETVRTDIISIKTFGSSVEKQQECDLVNLRVGTRNGGSVKITALAVPFICEPICSQPVNLANLSTPVRTGLSRFLSPRRHSGSRHTYWIQLLLEFCHK